MAVVLKLTFNGDILRTRVPELTWEELQRAVAACLPGVPKEGLGLMYRDDEGDLCLLTPASLSDLVALSEHATTVKLEVVQRQPQAAPASGQPDPWAPSPFAALLGHLAQHLRGCGSAASENLWTGLFQHFAPLLLQRLASSPAELDGLAARRPKAAAAVVAALREALEPFPQLQGPLGSLDGVSQAQHFEGLGAALEGLLRAALQLPEEQQRDVVSVLHAVVVERLLQLPSEEAAAAPAVGAPQGVACDGCDATPIAEHTFDHHEAVACSAAEGCSGGWPQGPWSGWGHHAWGKGWDHHGPAKGWGKGQGKGWGGHHAWAKGRGSHHGWAKGWGRHAWGPKGWGLKGWSKSWAKGWPQAGLGTDAGCADSSSDSSDSSEDPGRGPRAGRAPRSKSEPRPGTRDWKRARREACKQAWPAAKASKAAEGGAAPQPAAEAGALAPAPPAQEELLAALQAMGFHDRELNAQLLAAHGGDVEAALQQLL